MVLGESVNSGVDWLLDWTISYKNSRLWYRNSLKYSSLDTCMDGIYSPCFLDAAIHSH